MRHRLRPLLLLLPLLPLPLATACVTGGARPAAAPRAGSDLLTGEEIRAADQDNLYELVRTLRFRWLQSRGPDTILGVPGEVQVHLDDVRIGGVDALRNLTRAGVAYIRFYDPVAAAARWGRGYGHGAIYVSTREP